MKPAQLLDHFDRISDAPDAIPRLRRFILDLAVRGKLVEQDPRDEPASELLKQIQAEKARLLKEGKIGSEKPPIPANVGELAFELKLGWQPARISQILVELQTGPFGSSLHQSDYKKGGIPVINPASIKGERIVPVENMAVGPETLTRLSTFKLCSGDIVMARRGEMGRCAVVTEHEDGWLCGTGSLILRIPTCVSPRFLVTLIGSPIIRAYLGGSAVGATMQNLNQPILLNLVIALPPLAEQHRIVAKVDELMALCDRLEAALAKREGWRDRLVASSLNRLNNGRDPDAFHDHARFYFNHLPRLTTKPEHIQHLRQTILNLAVRGKLVPQDPNDEPASLLLRRIAEKKEQLIEAREIQRPKQLSTIDPQAMPFRLPKGWQWAYVWDVAKIITSGSRDWAKYYSNAGPIFVTMGNLSRGDYKLRMDSMRYVNPPADGEGSRTRLERDDLLISITGDVGNLGLIPADFGEAYINQHTCLLRFMPDCQNRYFPELMRSPWAKYQFDAPQRGIKNSFRLSDVGEMLIPVPPLAEQHRIVAKVDELMALCDKLDVQLTTTHTDSSRLLDAVLHEALAPAV